MRELEPTSEQETQTETNLSKLAYKQLRFLAHHIKDGLDYYADPAATKILTSKAAFLHKASAACEGGAYLNAIEYVCLALDLGE